MQGTGNPSGSPGRSGDYRGRPVWWAVLAVALGLMALVATMSFAGHTGPTRAVDAGHERRAHVGEHDGRAVDGRWSGRTVADDPLDDASDDRTAWNREFGRSAADDGPVDTARDDWSDRRDHPRLDGRYRRQPGDHVVAPPTGLSTTSPSTSPPETTTTTTVPAVQTFAGYLAYPDDVSATYQTGGGGTVSATATWTGTPTLSLTITCTSQHVSRNGESGISVAVTDDHSPGVPCNVTLAEPPSEEGTVSYSLSVSLASS